MRRRALGALGVAGALVALKTVCTLAHCGRLVASGNARAPRRVRGRRLHRAPRLRSRDPVPVVVIAELDHPPAFTGADLRPHVQCLNDDFTRVAALEKVGLLRASRVALLSDTTRGRGERDADAGTILAARNIATLKHEVYTWAEMNRRECGRHLERGNMNEYLVTGEHGAGPFTELFGRSAGNRLRRREVGACSRGTSFFDRLPEVRP